MDDAAGAPAITGATPHAGRRALVTGAASGIGLDCALRLGADGAAVVVNHLDGEREAAEGVVRQITAAGGAAIALEADVADEDQVVAMFAAATHRLGAIDLLVNNAGVESPVRLVDMSLEQWNKVISINLTGAFLCAREAARGMIAASRTGVIVNVTSVHEQVPWPGYAHYCASKAGTKLMGQTLARELAEHGIRVVNIGPGAIATPINQEMLDDPEQREAVLAQIPLGFFGESRDIAAAASWLAGDEARYVTGATLFVDGGMTLYPGVT